MPAGEPGQFCDWRPELPRKSGLAQAENEGFPRWRSFAGVRPRPRDGSNRPEGTPMVFDEIRRAAEAAPLARLCEVSAALWKAFGAGGISEAQAEEISGLIEARRAVPPTSPGEGAPGCKFASCSTRKRQRPPVRSEAIERRRRLAASGPMPPALAARFTVGELAVMRIVGDEHRSHPERGCSLCIDAIAARAGVSRTTAQNAIRQAVRLGMLERQERRRPGMVSLTNVLRVVDREWLAWLSRGPKGGGLKKPSTTDTRGFKRPRAESAQPRAREGRDSRKPLYGTEIGPFGKCSEAQNRAGQARAVEGQ